MSAQPARVTPINGTQPAPAAVKTPAELVAERASLKADIEFINERIAQIDAQLIEQLDTVGTHDVDGTKVEIREYSRLDTAWIEAEYPQAQYPQLYKTTTGVDAAAVKKQFAPAVLDEHKVRGAKSVVVR
jgi:hypothetical protein